jgi:cobalt-zinc-cadmium efflux system membrane fusion protein
MTNPMRLVFAAALLVTLVSVHACSKNEPAQTEAGPPTPVAIDKKDNVGENAVQLAPETMKTAGIELQTVAATTPSELIGATAVFELNGDRLSRVAPRVTGRCVAIHASQGDRVRAGQTMAEIDSVETDHAWTDYVKAKGRYDLATRSVRREEVLFEKKVSPEKDLLKARQELSQAEADLLLAKERFRALGVDVHQLEAAKGTSYNHPLVPVTSPLSGVVIEKTVTRGEKAGPEKSLFTVADLSTLWLMIDVYEQDLGRVRKGMQVSISTTAYPGKTFRGRISRIADFVDEKTRTVKARVTIDNRDGLLKPGMFATASIQSGTKGRKIIALPEEAIFLDGSERYVFVEDGNGRFLPRGVVVGPAIGCGVAIREGLKPGERVAVKGIFALKSELKKESLQAE